MHRSYDDIISALNECIMKPFIFYLPYNDFPGEIQTIIDNNEQILAITNTIISIGKNYEINTDVLSLPELSLINKEATLDNNIFMLLELKEEKSKASFNFIVEEYKKVVNAMCIIADWMLNHFESYFSTQEFESKKTLFSFQSLGFKNHLKKLNIKFPSPFSFPGNTDILKKYVRKEIPKIVNPIPFIANKDSYAKEDEKNGIEIQSTFDKPTAEVEKKSKRDRHINAEEARTFLLNTVFGLNLE